MRIRHLGQDVDAAVMGVTGLHLLCSVGEDGYVMVSMAEACDPAEFRREWTRRSGASKLYDEHGNELSIF